MNKIDVFLMPNDVMYFDERYIKNKEVMKRVSVEPLPNKDGYETILKTDYAAGTAQYEYVLKPETEIDFLKAQNEELTLATLDLADTVARQDAQLQEQSEALLDLANTLAEVMG